MDKGLVQLKNKILFFIILIFFAISLFEIASNINRYEKQKNEIKTSIIKQTKFIYTSKTLTTKNVFINKLKRTVTDKDIIEALKNKNKKTLYDRSIKDLQALKEDFPLIEKIHFHTQDSAVFLKVLHPQDRSYEPISKQQITMKTIQTKTIQDGFEIDETDKNIVYRIAMPILDKTNTPVGAIEIEVDIKGIVYTLQEFFKNTYYQNVHIGLLFKSDFDAKEKISNVLKLDKYKLISNNKELSDLQHNLDGLKNDQFIDINDKKYFIFWGDQYLINSHDNNVGTILYLFDITDIDSRLKSDIIRSITKQLIIMIILILLFLWLFNYTISQSKRYRIKIKNIVDNQNSIILVSNGNRLLEANKKFLEFFNIKSIEEFLKSSNCICDKFVKSKGFLQASYDELNWIEFILSRPNIKHKVKMYDPKGELHIFQVNAKEYEGSKEKEHIISFDDITDLEEMNQNLSDLVTKKTKELQELNEHLEEKVSKNIEIIRQKDQQIFQQMKLSQMGEMISMIAHQWRQPLTAISASSTSLKLKAELGNITDQLVIDKSSSIIEYSQHLSRTIDDFRNFFKPDKDKNKTNFNLIVDSVINIVGVSLDNQKIDLIQELNDMQSFVSFESELKQVLLNLIKNSEDILKDKPHGERTIQIITKYEDNTHILQVIDNAGGVKDSIKDKIFEPYFSTKDQKEGTGLGLYMSKIIIEDHCKGKLSMRNTEDGAIFEIKLFD